MDILKVRVARWVDSVQTFMCSDDGAVDGAEALSTNGVDVEWRSILLHA